MVSMMMMMMMNVKMMMIIYLSVLEFVVVGLSWPAKMMKTMPMTEQCTQVVMVLILSI